MSTWPIMLTVKLAISVFFITCRSPLQLQHLSFAPGRGCGGKSARAAGSRQLPLPQGPKVCTERENTFCNCVQVQYELLDFSPPLQLCTRIKRSCCGFCFCFAGQALNPGPCL